jgi:hypothetical protein
MAYGRGESPRVDRGTFRQLLFWAGVVIAGNQLSFAFSFHFASASIVALLFGTLHE